MLRILKLCCNKQTTEKHLRIENAKGKRYEAKSKESMKKIIKLGIEEIKRKETINALRGQFQYHARHSGKIYPLVTQSLYHKRSADH